MVPSMLSPTATSRHVTQASVLAALAAAASLQATPADAAELPAARFIEGIGTSSDTPPNGAHGLSDALAETIVYSAHPQNGNGAADLAGTVTTKNGASPSLKVEASAFGSAFYIVSSAEIDYSLVVVGPASALPVPVVVTFSGFGSAGATSGGDGTLEITSFGTRFLSQSLAVSGVFGPPTASFTGTQTLLMPIDQRFDVKLTGFVRADAYGDLAQASVSIDPSFRVDPAFPDAGLYRIAYSVNVVPEPGTGALLGLGAGVLAVLGRRRPRAAPAC